MGWVEITPSFIFKMENQNLYELEINIELDDKMKKKNKKLLDDFNKCFGKSLEVVEVNGELVKSYSKHFGLNESDVKKAVSIAKAIKKEWAKRLSDMSEEEYDIIEGVLIKQLAKKKHYITQEIK
jgi:hypothetical protein